MLATYSSFGALLWPVGVGLGLYVGNLQFFWGLVMACWSGFRAICWQRTVLLDCDGLLEWVWGCMSATYSSFGALLWPVGVALGLYVGNVQFFWGLVMACWSGFGAVRRQPTVLLGPCYGLLGWVWGCMSATYSSFGALLWPVGVGLGLYVGNLQFFWGLVMACWSGFGAVCRQPTVLLGHCYGLLGWVWGCMSATYNSFGALWPVGIGRQPAGLIVPCYCLCRFYLWFLAIACWSGFGALGNLHVLGSFERVSCCRLATCRSYWVVQRNFGCLTPDFQSSTEVDGWSSHPLPSISQWGYWCALQCGAPQL